MENETFNMDIISIEGLKVSPQSSVPVFVLLLLIYVFIMVSNLGLVVLIFMERSLQQPMYLLFCNMSINDAFGATTIIPRLLSDILVPMTQRYVYYIDCVVQAFCAHFIAGTSHTVLMIMAFDRYVAICNPLRYATIITTRMLVKLSVGAWVAPLVIVAVLMGLTIRLSRCRRAIFNPFCDNASLFKLSCENLLINHIYGLGVAVVILGSSLASLTLTYLRIAALLFNNKNQVLNSRALQTCATHLAVYIIMLVACFMPLIFHRRIEWAENGKVASVLFYVIPPALNPVIYGLQCNELRQKIISVFHKNKTTEVQKGFHK
ncbi:olfactory receptor 52D1-like [Plectropomus leopardus]|uniref:olfactory receptor 52D1-like n=1 Tax=Plectropomus leopardus TaxID=160734 RepID=UPI001C4B23E9|nr:olfactory receptor 52D1-like [Plectropomus leopardus]